ncbi:MAG: phosphatase PAP2 family protein [Spirochaetia bacterium]|jgi:acid phosphatase (class A)
MRRVPAFLIALTFLFVPAFLTHAQSRAPAAEPYLASRDLDIMVFLAPPPLPDSAQTKAEIAEILQFQADRTPAMAASAQADSDLNAFRFADVMGPSFTPTALPVTAAFLARVVSTAGAVVDPAKIAWNRLRPYFVDSRVIPCLGTPTIASYPSGHANAGYVIAIVLAQMVPEKRAEIFARAQAFALNRVIGGVHFRSDIEAGRLSGTLIAAAMFRQPDFQRDLNAARKELRAELGYPAQ